MAAAGLVTPAVAAADVDKRGWLPLGGGVWATLALARAHPLWRRWLRWRWRSWERRPPAQLQRGDDGRDRTAAGQVTDPAGRCPPRRRTHAATAARQHKPGAHGRDRSAAGGVTVCRHVPPAPLRPGPSVPAQHSRGAGVLCVRPQPASKHAGPRGTAPKCLAFAAAASHRPRDLVPLRHSNCDDKQLQILSSPSSPFP
ncbi:hypothetical protein I4F81_010002 [Pyropia yezoensis]|uniref:Uncharacterized protein n=1 Tax=Pyropia yezoensis TaxID=2788 RepID=A0ACC3CB79_PYRYE|nr:hypothetical protein I4F81_010002 [Neopyropia yezoensis]